MPNPFLTTILRNNPQFNKPKRPYIGPSNIITMCPREYALQYKHNQTKTLQFPTMFNFQTGFTAEDFVEYFLENILTNILSKANIQVVQKQVNVPVDNEVFSSPRGRTDQIIWIAKQLNRDNIQSGNPDTFDINNQQQSSPDDYYLLEIKKMNGTRFNRFKKYGYKSEEAALYQLLKYLQAVPYASNLITPVPTKGIIVGVCLDPPDMWDELIEWDPDTINDYLQQYKSIEDLMHQVKAKPGKFIPDRPYEPTSFQCKSCTVFEHCYPNYLKKITYDDLTDQHKELVEKLAITYDLASTYKSEMTGILEHVKSVLDTLLSKYKASSLDVSQDNFRIKRALKMTEEEKIDIDDVRLLGDEISSKVIYTKDSQSTYTSANTYSIDENSKDAAKEYMNYIRSHRKAVKETGKSVRHDLEDLEV